MSIRYLNYLSSNHWKRFNSIYRKRVGNRCEFCWSDKRTELHHITYARIGKERNSDVVLLCHSCHNQVHTVQYEYNINIIK